MSLKEGILPLFFIFLNLFKGQLPPSFENVVTTQRRLNDHRNPALQSLTLGPLSKQFTWKTNLPMKPRGELVPLEMTHKMLQTLKYRQQYNQSDQLEAESYRACEEATPRLLVSPHKMKRLYNWRKWCDYELTWLRQALWNPTAVWMWLKLVICNYYINWLIDFFKVQLSCKPATACLVYVNFFAKAWQCNTALYI